MVTVLITIHIMLVVAMIVLVLLQRSEGGALGIGGGGGGGFMSARGAADALTKTTTIIAAGFFLTSIALGVIATRDNRTEGVIERIEGSSGTGVPTEGGETAPAAGSLLEDLQREGQTGDAGVPGSGTDTGVPTSE